MTTDAVVRIGRRTTAVLDEEHVGDIRGALGTIEAGDSAPRTGLSAKLKTLLAIVGPGLIVVMVGAAAIMAIASAAFPGTGALFAVALLDGSIVGAFAVSLSSAYAIGDVFGMKHSLHRGAWRAKGFYAGLVALSAASGGRVLTAGYALRAYLLLAMALVIVKLIQLALG